MFDMCLSGYTNALNFKGRERRKAYAIFFVVHFSIFFAAVFAMTTIFPRSMQEIAAVVLVVIWGIPLLSFVVRRFHDNDSSGWWVLAGLLMPAVLLGVALIIAPRPTSGQNRYGPDPRTI
ncbi:hypothetical protein CO666_32945 [Rhizobium chutanense]|uniref:DUF805 domain-containing protein n=1 Tax=Rhizobium chutanense TaxID=2035448 RepID=A0A2A6J278_9HYPH|nr:DUF805 domain-containing protein [Rhizobium chutanense]PDT00020.1 hypothetical protein CO666_32945 [Rhizobium chutanense]